MHLRINVVVQVMIQDDDGTVYNLTRYYADWDTPRPESFREDQETARKAGYDPANPSAAAHQLWRDLASGAESGWDYSTRWFAPNSTDITTIRTTQIIPADLNAFLFQMETNIADFAEAMGCTDVAVEFRNRAADRREAIDALAWNEETGQWHDLVIDENGGDGVSAAATVSQNPDVYPSNWFGLFAGLVEANSSQVRIVLVTGLWMRGNHFNLSITRSICRRLWRSNRSRTLASCLRAVSLHP